MAQKDFFIGWRESMPERSKKRIRGFVSIASFTSILLVFLIVFYTRPFNEHRFELGSIKEFSGVFYRDPFPVLILDEGQSPIKEENHALLVGFGKNGAMTYLGPWEEANKPLSGTRIKIRGTLIYGDGKLLIELTNKEKSILDVLETNPSLPVTELGMKDIKGEIIDPKCYFGVMKPAEGKVHKSCAIRCISGGIPPVLRATTVEGFEYYILRGQNGENLNRDKGFLSYIGEPVSIKGATYISNGWKVLNMEKVQLARTE